MGLSPLITRNLLRVQVQSRGGEDESHGNFSSRSVVMATPEVTLKIRNTLQGQDSVLLPDVCGFIFRNKYAIWILKSFKNLFKGIVGFLISK